MATYSMKGAVVRIGSAAVMQSGAWEADDFTTLMASAVVIGEPETIASTSEEFAEVAFESVTDGVVRVHKGARKGGLLEFTHGADYADAGQTAVKAAFESEGDYAFEVEWADRPLAGASPSNSRRLFIGKVMKLGDGGEGSGVAKLTYAVQLNSNVVRVNASAT